MSLVYIIIIYLFVRDFALLPHYFQNIITLYRQYKNSVLYVSLKYFAPIHICYIAGVPGRIAEVLYARLPPIPMILH